MAMSYNGFLALGKETTRGTAVPRTKFIRFASAEMPQNPNWVPLENSQDRYLHEAMAGHFDTGLNAQIEARADNLGEVLRSLFWADPVKTTPGGATNARDHTYKPPATLTTPAIKPYSAELRYGTANTAELLTGFIVDEVTVQWDRQHIQAAIGGFGEKPSAVTPTASPSYTTIPPFMFHGVTATLFGASRGVRSGNIRIFNTATREWSSGSLYSEVPEAGAFGFEAQFTMVFADLDDRKRMWGGTSETSPDNLQDQTKFALNVKAQGKEIEAGFNHELEFDLKKAGVVSVTPPMSGKNQIVQTVNLVGFYDSTEDAVVEARLRNDNDTGY